MLNWNGIVHLLNDDNLYVLKTSLHHHQYLGVLVTCSKSIESIVSSCLSFWLTNIACLTDVRLAFIYQMKFGYFSLIPLRTDVCFPFYDCSITFEWHLDLVNYCVYMTIRFYKCDFKICILFRLSECYDIVMDGLIGTK